MICIWTFLPRFTAYGRPGAKGGGEDTHQRGKGRWRHNETRAQLNRQSAGAEANGVEERTMRVLWRRQQSFCLDDRRAEAGLG